MNLLQLRTLGLSWLDDVNGVYFTTSQMNNFINMATKEAQKILIQSFENRYTKTVYTTLVVDQDRYVYPDDFMKLDRLELETSGTGTQADIQTLSFTTLSQKDRQITKSGTPGTYVLLDDYIMLRPVPDQALTMRLYYTYRIPRLESDTDIPDVPEEYHEYIALRAAKFGFVKDGRESAAIDIELTRYLDDMKKDADNRNLDRGRAIVCVTGESIDPMF